MVFKIEIFITTKQWTKVCSIRTNELFAPKFGQDD